MEPTFFATAAAFRAWLRRHHADADELVVGFHKKGSGLPSISWPEAVDEALCFGWIDGVRRSLEPTSYTNRFTPRIPRSTWSARNIARVEELTTRLRRLGRLSRARNRDARSPRSPVPRRRLRAGDPTISRRPRVLTRGHAYGYAYKGSEAGIE